jgi:hypothetical protein
MLFCGDRLGAESRDPAGMMRKFPLLALWGTGEPHFEQKDLLKNSASGNSKFLI